MSEKRKKKTSRESGRKKSKKNLYALLIILIILGCGYLYITDMEQYESTQRGIVEHKEDYYPVENRDTAKYLIQIVTNKDYNIFELSKIFYKSDIFWPYIIKENTSLENPLFIEKNTLVRMPRIDDSLLDLNNKENQLKIKQFGDSLMNLIAEKNKAKAARSAY